MPEKDSPLGFPIEVYGMGRHRTISGSERSEVAVPMDDPEARTPISPLEGLVEVVPADDEGAGEDRTAAA